MLQFLGLRGVRHDLVREQEQQFASEPTIFLAKLVIGVLDLFPVVHGPEVTPMLTHIEAQEWAPFKIPGWALGPGVFPPDPMSLLVVQRARISPGRGADREDT